MPIDKDRLEQDIDHAFSKFMGSVEIKMLVSMVPPMPSDMPTQDLLATLLRAAFYHGFGCGIAVVFMEIVKKDGLK